MRMYVILGLIMNFCVSLILMLAVSPMSVRQLLRNTLAAGVGTVFTAMCMLPDFAFLQSRIWQVVCLVLTCMTAFGISGKGIRQGALYCLLRLALEGLAMGGGLWDIVWSLLLFVGFRLVCRIRKTEYVSVELESGQGKIRCNALLDTGNRLWDPITGRPVLVVDALVAQKLTGLTAEQLSKPVMTMGALPGLRLIPYRSVGGSGLLLALQLQSVRIGKWQGSTLVAFSPEILDQNGMYQALIGGTG